MKVQILQKYESTYALNVLSWFIREFIFEVSLHNLCIIFLILNRMTLGKNELRKKTCQDNEKMIEI